MVPYQTLPPYEAMPPSFAAGRSLILVALPVLSILYMVDDPSVLRVPYQSWPPEGTRPCMPCTDEAGASHIFVMLPSESMVNMDDDPSLLRVPYHSLPPKSAIAATSVLLVPRGARVTPPMVSTPKRPAPLV